MNTPDQQTGCFNPFLFDLNQVASPVRWIGFSPDEIDFL
jgi:hypothetical protein